MGVPLDKATPAFLLALLSYLRSKEQLIPEAEKLQKLQPFFRVLVDYSIQLLLTEDLLRESEFPDLTRVGLELPKEVFRVMCEARYPNYSTLIANGKWDKPYATYLSALSHQRVCSSVGLLRGSKALQIAESEALAIFAETRVQALKGLAENLKPVLDIKFGVGDKNVSLTFKLHPGEKAFVEQLRNSNEQVTRGGMRIKVLGRLEGLNVFTSLGYRDKEIPFLLRFLKARRLVNFNEEKNQFEEILESVDELRDAILAEVDRATQAAEGLAKIPDFGADKILPTLERISADILRCDGLEQLEECQAELSKAREQLSGFIKAWQQRLSQSLKSTQDEASRTAGSGLPQTLGVTLKGDVVWVAELAHCQLVLKNKYQTVFQAYHQIAAKAHDALRTWDTSDKGPNALVSLYQANLETINELDGAKIDLNAAARYLSSFQSWSDVLNAASRLSYNAISCQTTYKEESFKLSADKLFDQVRDLLRSHALEALAQHEMFGDKIRLLQEELDKWLRDRRDQYMTTKKIYEDALQLQGVSRFTLRANFDIYDPNSSYANLYTEVAELAHEHVATLENDLKAYQVEMLYAKKTMEADIDAPRRLVDEASVLLSSAKQHLRDDCVRDNDCFSKLTDKVVSLGVAVRNIDKELRGVLQKRTATQKEEKVLNMLGDTKGKDLKEIIANLIAEEQDQFSLEDLSGNVMNLFKKNQVVIRLEKRR
jgi:hypothetical protein